MRTLAKKSNPNPAKSSYIFWGCRSNHLREKWNLSFLHNTKIWKRQALGGKLLRKFTALASFHARTWNQLKGWIATVLNGLS